MLMRSREGRKEWVEIAERKVQAKEKSINGKTVYSRL